MAINPHSEYSMLRESILEHFFLGELGKELWQRGSYEMEILQAEIDAAGYDVVLTLGEVTRHVQLKTKVLGGRASSWSISSRLCKKPSGCIVVMYIDGDDLRINYYGYFGGVPGAPMPDISTGPVSKHTKANAQGYKAARKQHFDVRESRFDRPLGLVDLVDRLVGR